MLNLGQNEGQRPSKFELDRMLTQETPAVASPQLNAHKRQVEACKLPPLDFEDIQRRAAQPTEDEGQPRPKTQTSTQQTAANNNRWYLGLVALVAVLLATVVFSPALTPEPTTTFRGVTQMKLHTLESSSRQLVPWDGSALAEGDTVGFSVAGDHQSVVILSVDGAGQTTVFLPASGDQPVQISPGMTQLQGTAILDGTPGTEHFIAVFDVSVADAKALVEQHKHDLLAWSTNHEHVQVVSANRRPR